MATIVEALETMAAKGWWKEWQNPAWKQFVLTGDEKQLKKLPKFTEHSWLPPELLSALPAPSQTPPGAHGPSSSGRCGPALHAPSRPSLDDGFNS
jgi:hypothetical protein